MLAKRAEELLYGYAVSTELGANGVTQEQVLRPLRSHQDDVSELILTLSPGNFHCCPSSRFLNALFAR